MRSLFLLSVAAYVAVWWWGFVTLPERVPLRFGVSGEVDNWGTRPVALTVAALTGLGTAALLALAAWWSGRAPLTSPWVNLPAKVWWTETPERSERAHRMIRQDVYAVSALAMAMLVVVEASVVQASQQADPRIGWLTVTLLVMLVAVLLGYCAWLSFWRYRPDEPHQSEEAP